MQSRPIDLSQEPFLTNIQENSDQRTQYGFNRNNEHAPPYFPGGDRPEGSLSSASDADVPVSPSSSSESSRGTSSWRLRKDVARQTPPLLDRIAQYEKASTPPPKRSSDGPGFRIVPKTKKSGGESSAISDFPNGN